MQSYQLNQQQEPFEPAELEFWETKDFDDVLQGFNNSELNNESSFSTDFGWSTDSFDWIST